MLMIFARVRLATIDTVLSRIDRAVNLTVSKRTKPVPRVYWVG